MTDALADAIRELVRDTVRAELIVQRAAPMAPKILSIPAACAALGGLSRAMVYRELSVGRLRSVHVGRRVFIPEAAVADYIAECDAARPVVPGSEARTARTPRIVPKAAGR